MRLAILKDSTTRRTPISMALIRNSDLIQTFLREGWMILWTWKSMIAPRYVSWGAGQGGG